MLRRNNLDNDNPNQNKNEKMIETSRLNSVDIDDIPNPRILDKELEQVRKSTITKVSIDEIQPSSTLNYAIMQEKQRSKSSIEINGISKPSKRGGKNRDLMERKSVGPIQPEIVSINIQRPIKRTS